MSTNTKESRDIKVETKKDEKEDKYVVLLDENVKFYTETEDEAEKCVKELLRNLCTNYMNDYKIFWEKSDDCTWELIRINKWLVVSYEETVHRISYKTVGRWSEPRNDADSKKETQTTPMEQSNKESRWFFGWL